MSHEILFSPFKAGALKLPNRLVMAPLTRGRAHADGTPHPRMIEYYRQRASAGLIISEATAISAQGVGWVNAPRIYTQAHVEGWKPVTEAVHQAGGRIFLQLWHMGRASHPDFHNGALPVSASAIAAQGNAHTASGTKPYVTPRALETDEIPGVIEDYVRATKLAREAGFDGVEIHAANGYLIDQFLRDGSNQRTDDYGGSIANRSRFLLEVTSAVVGAWSGEHVGVRLSPTNPYNDMRDSDPVATFTHASKILNRFKLAYLHVLEGKPGHFLAAPGVQVSPSMRAAFKGPFIANAGYDASSAAHSINEDETDLVAFGIPFIANPDLVERFRAGAPLNAPDQNTFYGGDERGYTDYPVLQPVTA
ncbi:MAG TPA: alkene reductase [Verrucomicrobiae bacterium]